MDSGQAIAHISGMTCPFITPAQAAPVIGCNPQTIRIMARENPSALGFPVVVIGTRTKIPRVPFLRYVLGEYPVCSVEGNEFEMELISFIKEKPKWISRRMAR